MSVKLTEEQQAAVSCRDRSLLVAAAAGSGKTRVIIERIMERITGPEKNDVDDFLVITFTNAAANELRDRIEREISSRLIESPSDKHLKRQLANLPRAQISTIDAFCLSVVREFSHLCDLSPSVSIVEGAEADILRTEALENTLESLYEEMDKLPDVAELWSLLSASRDDRTLSAAIMDASAKIQSHPFPDLWMEDMLKAYEVEDEDFGATVWGKYLLDEAASMAGHAKQVILSALDLLRDEPVLSEKYSPALKSDLAMVDSFLSGAGKGWDSAVEAASRPLTRLGSAPRDYSDPMFRDRIKSMRDVWRKTHGSIQKSISETSDVHIEETRRILPAIRGLFHCVRRYEQEYGRIKTRRGLVDFNDVSHAVIRLLCRRCGDRIEPTEVAEMIGGRYAEVMIDEFQDTNGIQTLIADMLTYGRSNLFMVGDIKQSIYRFRLAEPEIFLARYNAFADYSDTAEKGVPVRTVLSRNFRSRPEIIGAVNDIFEKLMIGGFTQITYGDKERLNAGRVISAESDEAGGRPAEFLIIDVPGQEEDEEDSIDKTEAEAAYVARRIRSMLDEGMEIEEDGAMRKLRPGDIAILLYSTSSKASYFENALSMYGIESYTEKGGSVRRAELLCMLSFLKVIDNAYQDIPLVGVLTSPVYRFSSDELADIRSADRKCPMYEAVLRAAGEGNDKCARFIESLGSLRSFASESGVDRLIRHIYSVTGLPGIYSAMADGAGRRRNLMRLYEHAASYEASGRHGISGFVRYMEKTLENGTFGADETAGTDAVRIMTIHKSKGMEFPVVFLCDLSRKFNMDDTRRPVLLHPQIGAGLRILDHERMYQYPTAVYTAISRKIREESLAEEMRVLYVAMTRAKDRLIMTCALQKAEEKVGSVLREAGDPDPERIRSADGSAKWFLPLLAPRLAAARTSDGPDNWKVEIVSGEVSSKDISEDSADEKRQVERDSPECDPEFQSGKPRISKTEEKGGEDRTADGSTERDLPPDVPGYAEMIRERLEYRYPYIKLSQIPSKITATQLKGKAFESELAEGSAPSARPVSPIRRPRFAEDITGLTPAEKGTALHLAMQFADLVKCRDLASIRGEIERLRRDRILSERQADAVDPVKILRFIESDLGIRVFASERLQREFKFSLLDDANRYYPDADKGEKLLVQGVCDLFFEEADGLVVVDFKTDGISRREIASRAEGYRPQLDLYAYALERITSIKVKEKYIYFFAVDTAVRV